MYNKLDDDIPHFKKTNQKRRQKETLLLYSWRHIPKDSTLFIFHISSNHGNAPTFSLISFFFSFDLAFLCLFFCFPASTYSSIAGGASTILWVLTGNTSSSRNGLILTNSENSNICNTYFVLVNRFGNFKLTHPDQYQQVAYVDRLVSLPHLLHCLKHLHPVTVCDNFICLIEY